MIRICDLLSRLVLTRPTMVLDVTDLTPSYYVIRVVHGNEVRVVKYVVG